MAIDVLSTSAEVIRLLERSGMHDAARRRLASASADLLRATRLLERVLFEFGPINSRLPSFVPLERMAAGAAERLDTALVRFLTHELHYRCVPACCNASSIRSGQIYTIAKGLDFIGSRRPQLLLRFETPHVQFWLKPESTLIAPAAAEAFAQSPEGAARHWLPIAEALVEHPGHQVREFLLRAVARAEWPSAPRRLMDAVRRADRSSDPRFLCNVWQRRALARLER